jgi:membrane protein DedA with SNARE-associated domain
VWVIVAAAAGAILGDNTGYTIGRFGGYALIKRFGHYVRLDEAKLEPAQRFFRQHGDKTVFLGRFVSVLRTWVAFLAGVNRMPWHAFLVWNAAGGIIWAIIYGLLGFYLGRHVGVLERVISFVGIAGVVIAVVVVAVLIGVWWLRRRRARLAAGAAGQGSAMPTAGEASPVVHGASAQAVTLAGTPAGLTLASGATNGASTNGASTNGASARAVPRVRHGDTTGTRRPFVVRPIASGDGATARGEAGQRA